MKPICCLMMPTHVGKTRSAYKPWRTRASCLHPTCGISVHGARMCCWPSSWTKPYVLHEAAVWSGTSSSRGKDLRRFHGLQPGVFVRALFSGLFGTTQLCLLDTAERLCITSKPTSSQAHRARAARACRAALLETAAVSVRRGHQPGGAALAAPFVFGRFSSLFHAWLYTGVVMRSLNIN